MNITLILFLIGILGFILNRKNIILMLISIEIMLLAITFLILVSSLDIDDIIGQTYAIYIIVVAGAESAIGLGILVAFYRLKNSPDKNPISIYFYSRQRLNLLSVILPNSLQSINYSSGRKIESLRLEKYILITNKYKDFIIFKQIVLLMSENKHTTLDGLK